MLSNDLPLTADTLAIFWPPGCRASRRTRPQLGGENCILHNYKLHFELDYAIYIRIDYHANRNRLSPSVSNPSRKHASTAGSLA